MKRAATALLTALVLAIPAFAFTEGPPPKGPGEGFETRKTEILKRIDERIERLQKMKSCIQAAHSREDGRACREKFGVKGEPEGRHR